MCFLKKVNKNGQQQVFEILDCAIEDACLVLYTETHPVTACHPALVEANPLQGGGWP